METKASSQGWASPIFFPRLICLLATVAGLVACATLVVAGLGASSQPHAMVLGLMVGFAVWTAVAITAALLSFRNRPVAVPRSLLLLSIASPILIVATCQELIKLILFFDGDDWGMLAFLAVVGLPYLATFVAVPFAIRRLRRLQLP